MSDMRYFVCDICTDKASASFNGEHYLPPQGWIEFMDANTLRRVNEHACPQCVSWLKGAPNKRTVIAKHGDTEGPSDSAPYTRESLGITSHEAQFNCRCSPLVVTGPVMTNEYDLGTSEAVKKAVKRFNRLSKKRQAAEDKYVEKVFKRGFKKERDPKC